MIKCFGLLLMLTSLWQVVGTQTQTPVNSALTLYAVNKYPGEKRNCFDFPPGPTPTEPCDLRYGALYAGDELDWFESSMADRSVIKDLGLLDWNDAFKVPKVEPFPKLKPGEQRHITIDTSGADGANGAPGARGEDGADFDGVVRSRPRGVEEPLTPISPPKCDGKPRVDPLYVKAVVGHIYAIHVVDDARDFYALFRVESLVRGDTCTISWRLVRAADTLDAANSQQ